jgi:hypothetical protein
MIPPINAGFITPSPGEVESLAEAIASPWTPGE